MLDSAYDSSTHPPEKEGVAVNNECSVDTVTVLEELLAQSILLRDLYKIARWQTCNGELCRMHTLFEDHYKQQLHLVDALIDRVRILGSTGRVLAGDFLKRTRLSYIRGHNAPGRCVEELLDAHELILSATQLAGAADNRQWAPEYTVGLVVLTNDLQSESLRDQWLRQTRRWRVRTLRNEEWM
jgi:starvation-inducible DNA-binding protein